MQQETNIALASFGTRAAADSFWSWYRVTPVNNGQRNEESEAGQLAKVRWLSSSYPSPHWLMLLFPGEQIVHKACIWWARQQDSFLRPKDYEIQIWKNGRWIPLPSPSTKVRGKDQWDEVTFPPVRTSRMRLWMPPGQGAQPHPTVLGIAEFEVYSHHPNRGRPSLVPVLPTQTKMRSNPGFFNWPAVPGACGYRLEYSRDSRFPPDLTTSVELEHNFYTPAAVMAPGSWFWRVGAYGNDEGSSLVWSEPERIVVEDTMVFSLPEDWAKTDNWKTGHPRLAAAAVGRKQLLAWAKREKAELWDKIKTTLEGPLEYVAQLSNMASEPEPTQGEPPAEPPAFEGGLWNIDRWREIVAAGGRAFDVLNLASLAWFVTQEPRYKDLTKKWLLHIASWDPYGSTGINSVDHAAHDVLVGMANAYDLLYDQLTAEERTAVRTSISRRCEDLYQYLNPFQNDPGSNHPWFQTTALAIGALAVWDEVPEASIWVQYAVELYLGQFFAQGGPDGDWHEGSSYWTYGLGFVFDFCDAVLAVTGLNLYEHPWLKKTARFKIYVHLPGGKAFPFGDTHENHPNAEDAARMFRLAAINRDQTAQWWANKALQADDPKGPGLLAWLFLWWDPALPSRPPQESPSPEADWPMAAVFRDSGWAVSHTTLVDQSGAHFAIRSGRHHGPGPSHSHADLNHFVLRMDGEELLLDSGAYDYYGSPHFYNWFIQTRAHNTLLIDGEGQPVHTARTDGEIRTLLHSPAFDYILAEASERAYPGKLQSFRRHVIFRRPEPGKSGPIWFLLFDETQGVKPVKHEWLWHTGAEPIAYDRGFRTTHPKNRLTVRHFGPIPGTIEVDTGFPANAQPEHPLQEEWHVRFALSKPVQRGVLATLLLPEPVESTLELKTELDKAIISTEKQRDSVAFNLEGAGGASLAEWETDGMVLAILGQSAESLSHNDPDWLAVNTMQVKRNGTVLFEADHPVTVVYTSGRYQIYAEQAASVIIPGKSEELSPGQHIL